MYPFEHSLAALARAQMGTTQTQRHLSTVWNNLFLNSNTPARIVPYFVFTFLAVLYLRYLSTGISSRAIDGKPIIFAKVSPPGNYGR